MTRSADVPSLLAEKIADRYVLRLMLADDGLSCLAFVAPGAEPGEGPSPEEILDLLASCEATEGVDRAAVDLASGTLPADFPPEGVVVARGTPPVAPHEGYVELTVRPDTGEAAYAESAGGVVDFRERSDYDVVDAGQEIGIFHPPTAGTPGMTVTGHVIPVPGKTGAAVSFQKGVALDRSTNRIRSVTPGRVLFVGNVLSVEEEYVVRGDVDLSVGNIRNSGFVIVSGDVDDHFSIIGGKGIKVGGVVGAALLQSDGDITVSGVTGKGKGRIVCGGNLHARFLNEADVECWGNVVVETEIRASIVRAAGSILVPKGVVAGGECIAGRGIEVGTAGSHMGVATALSSGTDFRQRMHTDELRERLRGIEKEIARTEAAAGTEPPDEAALARMHPVRRELVEKQFGKLTALRTEALTIRDEISRANVENDPESNAMINVRGELFENTLIGLWHAAVRIDEGRQGPLSIIENTLDGSLRFLPLHPLKKKAREIEAAILASMKE